MSVMPKAESESFRSISASAENLQGNRVKEKEMVTASGLSSGSRA